MFRSKLSCVRQTSDALESHLSGPTDAYLKIILDTTDAFYSCLVVYGDIERGALWQLGRGGNRSMPRRAGAVGSYI